MVSAPLGIIALGIVAVQLRSKEPTQSLFARWPDQAQISKCEVRPATPLEISQGAQFGVTMQIVSPHQFQPIGGIRYSISEPALKSAKASSKILLHGICHEWHADIRRNAGLMQQAYRVWEETEAFNRSALKSANGTIEVVLKAGRSGKASPVSEKVFHLDTKQIPLPDAVAARKANFRITKAALSNDNVANLEIEDFIDVSQDLISTPQAVGKWTMEGHSDQPITVGWESYSIDQRNPFIGVSIRFTTKKHPPLAGAKFRGLISLNRGWPQEVTLEWPKKIVWNGKGPEVKFSATLAPLPKSAR